MLTPEPDRSPDAIPVMPLRPRKGEVWLALNLSRIQNLSPWAALKLAEELGFVPELRYRQDERVEVYAVLYYELRDYEQPLPAGFLEEQLWTLAERIQPSEAIQFFFCLKPGREAVEAA